MDTLDLVQPVDENGRPTTVPALGSSFKVAYDASAASSLLSTYSTKTWVALRVTTTTDAFVTSAAAPTALADGTHHFCPAGIPQDIRVPTSHKLAFIKLSVAGSAYCTVLK